jgi:hypothetical protein
MAKAIVTLKEGLRYYRLDGTFRDCEDGEEVELEDIPPFSRTERIRDGHLKPLAPTAAEKKADAAAQAKADKAQERADQRADDKAEQLAEDKAAVKAAAKK